EWPQNRALGDTTRDRLPTGFNSIHLHSLGPAIQPVFYPAKRMQASSSQFCQKNAVGNETGSFEYSKCLEGGDFRSAEAMLTGVAVPCHPSSC
ncbi:unnamed protein product, partial [Bubo scandiacus]